MRKCTGIKLDDLKWEATKIIGPPVRIFLEGDEIVGVQFAKETDKSVKNPIKQKRGNRFLKFLKNGKMRIKLV